MTGRTGVVAGTGVLLTGISAPLSVASTASWVWLAAAGVLRRRRSAAG